MRTKSSESKRSGGGEASGKGSGRGEEGTQAHQNIPDRFSMASTDSKGKEADVRFFGE
jgi:hypothetical protein